MGCQRETARFALDVPPSPNSSFALPSASRAVFEAPPPPRTRFAAGDEVEVEWQGTWYPARVLEVTSRTPELYLIHYDGYGEEWDEAVGLDRVRSR